MDNKVIFFRQKGYAGPYACSNGEIESAVNITAISQSGSVISAGREAAVPPELIDPAEFLSQLNRLSSSLLPVVEFALLPAAVEGWSNHPDNLPSATVVAPKVKDSDGWTAKAVETLERFEKAAARSHLFTEPFFVLSALRLADGSHILPSSPVLMLPNSNPPSVEGSDNLEADTMSMTINTRAGRLGCRIYLPEELSEWTDRIEALDIFISSPIPLYHRDEGLKPVHRAPSANSPQSWLPVQLSDHEFTSALLAVSSFRMVSSIPLGKLSDFLTLRQLTFNVPDLPKAPALSGFVPDYLQHHGIAAASGAVISGRITLVDLTLTLPVPPPAGALIPYDPSADSRNALSVALETETCKNGLTLHSSHFDPEAPKIIISESDFPKWIFIPDPDARQLTLTTSDATYVVPLRRHPVLNGAYYWSGSTGYRDFSESGVRKLSTTFREPEHSTVSRDTYRLPDAIWRSWKGLGLHFPDSLLSIADVGRVMGVCRAFRSSGLVATTSPTAYLFTDKGIFLMKEMEDGTLHDAGLIANHMLSNPESIRISGSSLYFTSASGEHMVISGSTVKTQSPDQATANIILLPSDPTMPVKITTRPLKGLFPQNAISAETDTTRRLKDLAASLRSICLSGAFEPSSIKMELQGSRDLISWHTLAKADGAALRGLYLPGLPYCRLVITGYLDGSLEALSVSPCG